MKPVRWHAGEPGIRSALEGLLARGPAALRTIQSNPRRSLLDAELPVESAASNSGRRIVLKIHHTATGRHRLRNRLKRAFGRSAAEREWRALAAFTAAGVSVPRPLAHGTLANGDELIVTERVPGASFADAFAAATAVDAATDAAVDVTADEAAGTAARRRMLDALAATIARMEAAGFVHGDLHLGNLAHRSDTGEVVLLDLQRARRVAPSARAAARRSAAARSPSQLADLARLELSLLRADWPSQSRDALRFALAPGAGFDAALAAFAGDHLRGRARRAKRSLRPARTPTSKGLRDACIAESTLQRVVALAQAQTDRRIRRGGRGWIAEIELEGQRFVVKWRRHDSFGERLAAALRGSPAARAFRAGRLHGLLLPRVAPPLAFLEERQSGLPCASWLVLGRVGDEDLDAHRPASAQEAKALARALGRWLADYHALGLGHRDMKGSNLRLTAGSNPKFWFVDLEDLTGPARPRDDERLAALAALNASLADESFDLAARSEALAAYRARLPFADPSLDSARAKAEIARRSRARAHRWRGQGCGAGEDGTTVRES